MVLNMWNMLLGRVKFCIFTNTQSNTLVTFFHLKSPTLPSLYLFQQQVHTSFSGLFLFGSLNDPLYVGTLVTEGFFCLFSLAPTATTMSSTSFCWCGTSPSLSRVLTRVFGGSLADVSKNIMPWALAKLIAHSWFTCPSVLQALRRSLLFPIKNLGGEQAAERDKWRKMISRVVHKRHMAPGCWLNWNGLP